MADKPKDDEVITETPEEVVEPSQPAPSQPPEDTVDTVQEDSKVEEEQVEEVEEDKPPSRREQLRIQDLLNKYGPATDRTPSSPGPDFRNTVQADEDTYKALETTAQQYGKSLYNEGLAQVQYYNWETLLNVDDTQVKTSHDILNPTKKDVYHPVVANALYAKYARTVGFDPGNPKEGIPPSVKYPQIRFSDFVDSEFEFAEELASQRVTQTTQNIAKQAANTGIRPGGGRTKGLDLTKAPQNMTDEELKAVIAQSM